MGSLNLNKGGVVGERALISSIVIIVMVCMFTQASGQEFAVRPCAKLGFTLSAPTQEELGYDPPVWDEDYNLFFFGLGAQVMYYWPGIGVGADMGFQPLYTADFNLPGSIENRFVESERLFHLLGVAELTGMKPFLLQFGLGLYIRSWESEYIWAGETYEEYDDTEQGLGFMVAGGTDIPVSDIISVPIMARFDMVLPDGLVIPLSVSSGLTIHLGGLK